MSLSPYVPTDPEELLSGESLLQAISVPISVRDFPLRTERINVSHVASAFRCYPGEKVNFYTRLQVGEALTGFRLEIRIPAGFRVTDTHAPSGLGAPLPGTPGFSLALPEQPVFSSIGREHHVTWQIDQEIAGNSELEFCVETAVQQTIDDYVAVSRAVVTASARGTGDQIEDEEEVTLAVTTLAAYLRYLPAIFTHDPLMSRFLMLTESFLAPVEQQIDGIENYFDPGLAPKEFLPWLASWIALNVNEYEEAPYDFKPVDDLSSAAMLVESGADLGGDNPSMAAESDDAEQSGAAIREPLCLPSAAQNARKLIGMAQHLHKKRGTRSGLQRYLEVYTEAEVYVIEHRADNFALGADARMGRRIALGSENQPHTFTVILRFPVPRSRLAQMSETLVAKRLANIRRRVIPIIEEQRPAHTDYTLQIDVVAV
jgi:hypothetical protein